MARGDGRRQRRSALSSLIPRPKRDPSRPVPHQAARLGRRESRAPRAVADGQLVALPCLSMWLLIAVILLGMAWLFHSFSLGSSVVLTLFSLGLLCLAWGILGYFRKWAWRAGPRPRQVWVRRRTVTTSWDWLPLRAIWHKVGPAPAEVELKFDPRPTQDADPYLDS
jgi:hypothetical protein